MLRVENVWKTFNAGTVNEKTALAGLNLHLNEGDFVTVIGGNGAGKSTMLNAVAGTFAVDAGLFYRHAVAASHRVTFGFQAANVGGALDYGAGNRQLPWVLKAGAATELGLSEAHGLTLTAETEYRLRPSELRGWSGSFGAEYRCFGILALRGGYRMGDRSAGEYRYGSAGAGLRWKYVAADAAYLLAGSSSPLRNTWILSVLFSW